MTDWPRPTPGFTNSTSSCPMWPPMTQCRFRSPSVKSTAARRSTLRCKTSEAPGAAARFGELVEYTPRSTSRCKTSEAPGAAARFGELVEYTPGIGEEWRKFADDSNMIQANGRGFRVSCNAELYVGVVELRGCSGTITRSRGS